MDASARPRLTMRKNWTAPCITEKGAVVGSRTGPRGRVITFEAGIVSHDAELIYSATDFVADVIALSEPVGSPCAAPEPNMLSYEVDEAAMWEAAEAIGRSQTRTTRITTNRPTITSGDRSPPRSRPPPAQPWASSPS